MKKLFTRILLGALAVGAPSASAYTVDEIIASSEYMIANFNCMANLTDIYGGELVQSYGIHLSKVSDTQIKFSGFMGKLDFVFTLVDANGNPTADGDELRITSDTKACGGQLYNSTEWYIYPCQITRSYYGYSQKSDPSYSYWIQINKDNSTGKLYFEGEHPIRIYTADAKTNVVSGMLDVRDTNCGLYFWNNYYYPMECNGIATDCFKDYNFTSYGSTMDIFEVASMDRSYGVYVDFDKSNGKFSILNFGNNGYGISPQQTSFVVGGTIDTENKKLIFNTNQFAKWAYCQASPYQGYYYEYQIERFSLDKDYETVDELFGYYTDDEAPHHNTALHSWVTNDGTRKTFEGLQITVEPYTYYRNAFNYGVLNFLGGYHDTNIEAGVDVTADVDLVLEDVGCDAEAVRVVGHIVTNKNDMYVDHYELCVVPGRYTSINDHAGFTAPEAEHGHTNATNIHHSSYDYNGVGAGTVARIDAAADGSHDYSFDKIMPKSEIGYNNSNEYTFYIKAVYDTDTHPQLTPTFHSMQTTEPQTNGLGIVNVSDMDAAPEYYNMQGVRVTNPEKGRIYIMRRGASASKVRF